MSDPPRDGADPCYGLQGNEKEQAPLRAARTALSVRHLRTGASALSRARSYPVLLCGGGPGGARRRRLRERRQKLPEIPGTISGFRVVLSRTGDIAVGFRGIGGVPQANLDFGLEHQRRLPDLRVGMRDPEQHQRLAQ